MNKHLIKVCLIASGHTLVIPLALHAAPPMHGPEGGCGAPLSLMGKPEAFDAEHLPPHLKELNLSGEQRAKIGEILKIQGQAMRDQFNAGKNTHDALRKLSLSSEYTEDKAKTLSEEGAKAMAEATLLHSRMDHAIYELLTPGQQQQRKGKMANFERHFPKP